ncbi:MAG: hypothetical protein KAU03_00500 [Candidatus Altiarchaeales archaeon]|nr:hypothetical protein [Candidatus Altiarchaeales archaeon]
MKNKNKILVLTLSAFLLSAYASAYTIDGNLNDWGVTPFTDWIPNTETVDWVVEDNIDPTRTGDPAYPDWTGYYATGIHIQGTGSSSQSQYIEPLLYRSDWWTKSRGTDHYLSPAGGEHYDIEAMYFDDDSHNAYFAIVTSMGPEGYDGCYPGDLALDLDRDPSGSYEYGIVLIAHDNLVQGQICYEPTWSSPTDFPDSGPVKIASCDTKEGIAEVAYKDAGITDKDLGNTHYGEKDVKNWVIEIRAPKTALGEPLYHQISNLHATITCGNDIIELLEYKWDFSVPEFVSGFVAFLIVLVTPGFAYLISKK